MGTERRMRDCRTQILTLEGTTLDRWRWSSYSNDHRCYYLSADSALGIMLKTQEAATREGGMVVPNCRREN